MSRIVGITGRLPVPSPGYRKKFLCLRKCVPQDSHLITVLSTSGQPHVHGNVYLRTAILSRYCVPQDSHLTRHCEPKDSHLATVMCTSGHPHLIVALCISGQPPCHSTAYLRTATLSLHPAPHDSHVIKALHTLGQPNYHSPKNHRIATCPWPRS